MDTGDVSVVQCSASSMLRFRYAEILLWRVNLPQDVVQMSKGSLKVTVTVPEV